MTTYTSPDLLPAPVAGEPADGPNQIDALADATQVALNKRAGQVPAFAQLTRISGWQGSQPLAAKMGRYCQLTSYYSRNAAAGAMAANAAITLGTVPDGWRPTGTARFAAAWSANGVRHIGQVWVEPGGDVLFVPTVSAALEVGDWVAVDCCIYVTP